jgi:hypothetical protein
MAAEYQIIRPVPARAQEIAEFHTIQLGAQLAAAQVDPEQIAAHLEAMRGPEAVATFAGGFERRLRKPGFYCRVVEQDTAVKGLIMAVVAGTTIDHRRNGANGILNLEVAEELHSQDVATKLMGDFLTEHADPKRFTNVSVLLADLRSRRYYEDRWGFPPVGHDATMIIGGAPVRALTMTRWPDKK